MRIRIESARTRGSRQESSPSRLRTLASRTGGCPADEPTRHDRSSRPRIRQDDRPHQGSKLSAICFSDNPCCDSSGDGSMRVGAPVPGPRIRLSGALTDRAPASRYSTAVYLCGSRGKPLAIGLRLADTGPQLPPGGHARCAPLVPGPRFSTRLGRWEALSWRTNRCLVLVDDKYGSHAHRRRTRADRFA